MRTATVEKENEASTSHASRIFRRFGRYLVVIFLPWLELWHLNQELPRAFEDIKRYSDDLYSRFRKAQDSERALQRHDIALLKLEHESQMAELEQKHVKKITVIELEAERQAFEKIVAAQMDSDSEFKHLESVHQSVMNEVIATEKAKYQKSLARVQYIFDKAVKDQGVRHRNRLAKFNKDVDSTIDNLIDIADEEREGQLERIKLEYEKRLERQDDKYRKLVSREQATQERLFEDLLPKIKLVKDSSGKLANSNARQRAFTDLRNINDRPEEVRGEKVRMTEWRELRPTKKDRIYYRRSQDARSYLVLFGDKKTQSRDIDWMRHN